MAIVDVGSYPHYDLRGYLKALEDDDLLVRVTRPINKDTELVPLVRLQFRGLPESHRRGFLFENVVDSRGRRFDGAVAIATFASSRAVYAHALGVSEDQISGCWSRALSTPLATATVASAPCQEIVVTGAEALEASRGVDAFAHPVSTPGFDPCPFVTAGCWVTRDSDDGSYNLGIYRGMVKGPRRLGLQMDTPSQHIAIHLAKARRAGHPLEVAIVIGAVPAVALASAQKVPFGMSEYEVAGGIMGRSLDVVRAKTVDLDVPAHAEIVIEGVIDPHRMEKEGPFGEASGYMGARTISPEVEVTCITHRSAPIVQSFISEFPPSESTLMRKIGFENVYLRHLRTACNIGSVVRVAFVESASCNMFIVVQLHEPTPGQAWQALYAIAGYEPSMGKYVVAVDSDIDVDDPDALVWALSYRTQPTADLAVIGGRLPRLDPSLPTGRGEAVGSALLVDATRGRPYPPTSLPARSFMESARALWEELDLPHLRLRTPWYGEDFGAWDEENRNEAVAAVESRYLDR